VTRGQQLAVTVTCLVAALTYAGAVTMLAMGLFVLPGVAIAALLASILAARHMSGMAIGVVGALVLGWAELVNIWSGTAYGAAARSTAFAAGWTVIAVVLAHSRWPALFLAGVAGVVAGALVLGAAGEVRIVVVAAAVCAALTLGWIERSRRNWTAQPRRGIALVLLSLLAGAAAAGAVLLQAQKDPRDPVLFAQGRENPTIKPAWTDPLAKASNSLAETAAPSPNPRPKPSRPSANPHRPRDAAEPTAKHATPSSPTAARKGTSRSIWFYVVAAIVLAMFILAVLIAARLLLTRVAWRRVRRRLAAGTAAEQVTGAWAWTRLRLDACGMPLAASASPDVIVAERARLAGELKLVAQELAKGGHPTGALAIARHTPLQALAAAATTAAFAPMRSLGVIDAPAAWVAADKAYESARELLSRSARARLAFRRPALAGPSADEEVVPGGRRLSTMQVIIMAASGLILCFAILAGFGVFTSGKAVSIVSTLTKPATAGVSTSTPTVTTPTTPRHAPLAPAPAPSRTPLGHAPSEAPVAPAHAPSKAPVSRAQAPTQTLAPGNTGAQVTILQRALAALGFLAGTPDGDYGPATQTAVARFQASKGLPQLGIVGPQTLAALQQALRHARVSPTQVPTQTLAPGDTGAQVTILQRALAALGFSAGTPDGDYGPGTQTAVARFQASKGLPQLGIVGPQTLAALQRALSRRSRP
jgi:peptidoglycan hydrolase-like protein with peptidoglycan-binding domain